MLKFVFIKEKYCGILKVKCSKETGNLPDFSVLDLDENGYEKRLAQHELYEKQQQALLSAYSDNIELFLKNASLIKATPKFANMVMPNICIGGIFSGTERIVSLGEMLEIYQNEPDFTMPCEKCGGKSLLTNFGYFPLSGSIVVARYFCIDCNTSKNTKKLNKRPTELAEIRKKYFTSEPTVQPAPIVELLKLIGGSKEIIDILQGEQVLDTDIIIPSIAFTENFCLAAIKAGLSFKHMSKTNPKLESIYIPQRFLTPEFIERVFAELTPSERKGVQFGGLPRELITQKTREIAKKV